MENTDIYIGNLTWDTTDEELLEFLGSVGEVLNASVQRHADSQRSKGWGLATYAAPEGAALAVSQLDQSELKGRPVHVRFDRSKIENVGGVNIFVGNIPWEITSEQLYESFFPFQPIDVHVKTNMAGRSRGFAIAKFPNQELADAAVAQMNGKELQGRQLQVREDKAPHERAVVAPRVYVGKLSAAVAEEGLINLFSEVGTVIEVRMARYSSGQSKGWAIITLSSLEEAQLAIEVLNGREIDGQQIVVRGDRKRV
uniref:RRM domain-containing protein n=1 Tax=Phaeomonas parva TaxID=124430 RepID=A0A6U4FSY9_9STRA|mmetsp:Transcript_27220/g.85704  ORF Transcript_27220/g.85704 Transcript_27220/m.85704 type:complete len:255 (+) Transcript_27220:568-1332(+)|eukprot:CAMPEP_0118857978 /NCGR_PEP_ID=MMETSP1163-20130328/4851_1 /TAXON_ID=124430 /ORGANISM="Phaeomonas parva, Strain CCMP2877" /LENGTH=254 /DNA_ID=CAMNT_0006791371 /DNA_START=449 /DNA_END=1213 /DNA_ORIENTATION=-